MNSLQARLNLRVQHGHSLLEHQPRLFLAIKLSFHAKTLHILRAGIHAVVVPPLPLVKVDWLAAVPAFADELVRSLYPLHLPPLWSRGFAPGNRRHDRQA